MKPYWWARTVFGITFDTGIALSIANFILTWRNRPKDKPERIPENRPREPLAPAETAIASAAAGGAG